MKSISSLSDAQAAINELANRLDTLSTKNWDRKQTRIVNVHPSVDPYDVVVRKELDSIKGGESTIVSAVGNKATFGLNDATVGNDKTPHYFVRASGIPTSMKANAKVAPTGTPLILTLEQQTADGGVWTELLDPTNRLTIPLNSTWIHELTTFATGAALTIGSLLRIAVTQGDSAGVCREVEVILEW